MLADPATRPGVGARGSCSARGKFGHELLAGATRRTRPVAIVRLEQLYPWPARRDRGRCSARYPNAEVIWAQEEPGNMGARYFARRRIEEIADGRPPVDVVARPESPSPATGSSTVHDAEQERAARSSTSTSDADVPRQLTSTSPAHAVTP